MPCSRWCYKCGYAHEDMEVCPYEEREREIRRDERLKCESEIQSLKREISRLKKKI